MSGFQKTGECYLAQEPEDVAFFDASAIAAGYAPTDESAGGLVAWEATVKEIVTQDTVLHSPKHHYSLPAGDPTEETTRNSGRTP